jgi:hypothetical protein
LAKTLEARRKLDNIFKLFTERKKKICHHSWAWWYRPVIPASTWKAEAGGSRVPAQPGLHSKVLSQNKYKTNNKENPLQQRILHSAELPFNSEGKMKTCSDK